MNKQEKIIRNLILAIFNVLDKDDVEAMLENVGIKIEAQFKQYGLTEFHKELTDPFYQINKLYKKSGIRFYNGKKLIKKIERVDSQSNK